MKRIYKQLIFAIPILVLGLSSCYPEFDATVSELDIAVTKYDKGQDFMELQTFYMEDTVMFIGEEGVVPNADHKYDDHIIQEVRDNFLRLGWVEVTDTTDMENKPDVFIFLSALETDVYYYYWYWWDYWWWYPWDWWYPIYPGYPIYPIYPSYPVYGYSVGTVLIDMLHNDGFGDVENPENPIVKPPIAWTGGVNGILAGSDENMTQRLSTQIKQVFDQSEYLIKKEPRNE